MDHQYPLHPPLNRTDFFGVGTSISDSHGHADRKRTALPTSAMPRTMLNVPSPRSLPVVNEIRAPQPRDARSDDADSCSGLELTDKGTETIPATETTTESETETETDGGEAYPEAQNRGDATTEASVRKRVRVRREQSSESKSPGAGDGESSSDKTFTREPHGGSAQAESKTLTKRHGKSLLSSQRGQDVMPSHTLPHQPNNKTENGHRINKTEHDHGSVKGTQRENASAEAQEESFHRMRVRLIFASQWDSE